MLRDEEDAYGHALYDYLRDGGGFEIVERDDGYFDVAAGPGFYFTDYDEWPTHERKAMEYARGRVLDVGCGAGRHGLYLQGKGLDVTGIDISPLAVEVCLRRGLRKVKVMSVTQISSKLGNFDTVLMLGNNFGLFGSRDRARRLLAKLNRMTTDGAKIIAESNDPYRTDISEHLAYHELNRKRGRMPGQLRIRVRYRAYVTPWFDYLIVSQKEMEGILKGTDWQVERFIESGGSQYIGIIGKKAG
jgi:SAM-dependent methyltransferase